MSLSFSILTKDLSQHIALCNIVSPKRSEVDLFTMVRVEISADGLQLASTNGSLFYISKVKLQKSELLTDKYIFLVKTEAFHTILSIMTDEIIDITVDMDKLTLVIKGEKAKHQLRFTKEHVDDYKLPHIEQENVAVRMRVKAEELIEADKAAFISVGGKNMYQPEFWNVCYTVRPKDSHVVVVSTDRYRITKTIVSSDFIYTRDDIESESYTNYLIPPKTLQLLASTTGSKETVEIVFQNDMAFFLIEGSTIVSRYGEGKYADYEKIIPQSFACTFELAVQEFTVALKQVFWCVRNDHNKSITISVDPAKHSMVLSSKNSDGEKAEYMIQVSHYEGLQEEWNQSFNGEYLLDYIGLIKTENFVWEANPGKPTILSPKRAQDGPQSQLYLVTGLR